MFGVIASRVGRRGVLGSILVAFGADGLGAACNAKCRRGKRAVKRCTAAVKRDCRGSGVPGETRYENCIDIFLNAQPPTSRWVGPACCALAAKSARRSEACLRSKRARYCPTSIMNSCAYPSGIVNDQCAARYARCCIDGFTLTKSLFCRCSDCTEWPYMSYSG